MFEMVAVLKGEQAQRWPSPTVPVVAKAAAADLVVHPDLVVHRASPRVVVVDKVQHRHSHKIALRPLPATLLRT